VLGSKILAKKLYTCVKSGITVPNIKEKIEMSTMQICTIEVNNLFKLKQIPILNTEKGTCNVSVYQPRHHYFDIHFYDTLIPTYLAMVQIILKKKPTVYKILTSYVA
jgi:hypothetical protein